MLAHAAAVLGHASADAVDARRTFKETGLDSIAAVELHRRLGVATGLQLPVGLVYSYPTPAVLAKFIRKELTSHPERAVVTPAAPVSADEPIAIVGMGCRLPGGVRDPEGMWDLLASGADAIGPFPADRGWDLEGSSTRTRTAPARRTCATAASWTTRASSTRGSSASPRARRWRWTRSSGCCWRCRGRRWSARASTRQRCAAAGPACSSAPRTRGYGAAAARDAAPDEGYLLTGTATSVISGRVSYTLGLEGPAVTVDTACSSSLVALHLAVQALRHGECTLALAGGVTVMATPGDFVEFSRQRGLAADGRCKAFSAAADGTGWAEGAGMLAAGAAVRRARATGTRCSRWCAAARSTRTARPTA